MEPPVTVLAGALALTACGGGSPSLTPAPQTDTNPDADPSPPGGGPTSQPLSSADQQTLPPAQEPTLPPGAPLVSDQHFHYNLTRAG